MAVLYRLTNLAAVGLALLGTLGILLMVVHITLDVVLRSTLSISIPATLELVTRYYLITLALLPLGWVEWRRNMISVEALEGLMGPRLIRISDVLVSLLSAAIYATLADVAARFVIYPVEAPVGAITAVVGAGTLVLLLMRRLA